MLCSLPRGEAIPGEARGGKQRVSTSADFPLLGAHVSVSGGLHLAVERGLRVGCRAIQIFTRNKNRWHSAPLSREETDRFRSVFHGSGLAAAVAHGSYLINLASPSRELLSRSLEALSNELERASALGIPYLILHPGSSTGSSEGEGLARLIESIDELGERTRHLPARLALETTAGQGTSLCWRFEQLARIWDEVRAPERLFLCVDTCHLFAAGYDLSTEEGYRDTFRRLEQAVPLERIVAFHLNDSKRERGSRVDRHEHIGRGRIGLAGFRLLLNDGRFCGIPMLLETPKGPGMKEDRRNLAQLRRLVKPRPSPRRAHRRVARPTS